MMLTKKWSCNLFEIIFWKLFQLAFQKGAHMLQPQGKKLTSWFQMYLKKEWPRLF